MPLKNQTLRTLLNVSLLFLVVISLLFNASPAFAFGNGESSLPSFPDFSRTVQNGEANVLRGVYVSDVMALPIVQQPAGNAGYVTNRDGEIIQFGMASKFGNVGLLAHNH